MTNLLCVICFPLAVKLNVVGIVNSVLKLRLLASYGYEKSRIIYLVSGLSIKTCNAYTLRPSSVIDWHKSLLSA